MKKIYLTFMSLVFLLNLSAQEPTNDDTKLFRPNWYVGANGGINAIFAEGNVFFDNSIPHIFSFGGNCGSIGRAEVGFNLTPVIGLRGFVGFGQHNWANIELPNGDGTYKIQSFGSEHVTLDVMINLNNWWGGYKPDRTLNFSIFGGGGFIHRDKANFVADYGSLCVRAGAQASLRLNRDIDLNLNGEGNMLGDKFNGVVLTFPYDVYLAATVGFTYHLPEKQLKIIPSPEIERMPVLPPQAVEKPTSIPPVENIVIAKTDTKSNSKTVADTKAVDSKTVDKKPTKVKPVVQSDRGTEVEPMAIVKQDIKPESLKIEKSRQDFEVSKPAVGNSRITVNILFPINETDRDKEKQKEAIAKIAGFMDKHPRSRIVISGYGSGRSGKLTDEVGYIFINMYGISRNRISKHSIPTKQQAMNRLVVVTAYQ